MLMPPPLGLPSPMAMPVLWATAAMVVVAASVISIMALRSEDVDASERADEGCILRRVRSLYSTRAEEGMQAGADFKIWRRHNSLFAECCDYDVI